MNYIKERQFYIDLYDLRTIKECLDMYCGIYDGMKEKRNEFPNYDDEKFEKEAQKALHFTLLAIKLERYKHKEEFINKQMSEDLEKQSLLDNASVPLGIVCDYCNGELKEVMKDLHDPYKGTAKVHFMFQCIECNKRQSYYEDGTKWSYEKEKCPKCSIPFNYKMEDIDEVLITTYTCPKCSFSKEEKYDFKKSRIEREAEEQKDKLEFFKLKSLR